MTFKLLHFPKEQMFFGNKYQYDKWDRNNSIFSISLLMSVLHNPAEIYIFSSS